MGAALVGAWRGGGLYVRFFGLLVGEFSSAIWGCFGKISFGNRVPLWY